MLTHVAIRFQGKIWSLPAPNRHHNVIRMIVRETGVQTVDVDLRDDQGFLDENGTYYGRAPALVHALACGQLKDRPEPMAQYLYSEDLW